MPGLIRQRVSGGGAASSQRRLDLPPYEPLAFPLTAKAQQDLSTLYGKHPLKQLEKLQNDACTYLLDNVAGINDTYYLQAKDLKDRKRKLSERDEPDEEEEARVDELQAELDELKSKVEEMTERMDDNMRKVIDSQQQVTHIRDVLKDITRDAVRGASSAQASSQQQTSRSQRRVPGGFQSDDDDDEEPPATFTPTDAGQTQNALSSSAPRGPGLHVRFIEQLDRKKDRYEAYTRRQRYGANNQYRQFRKMLHDAQHPDDDAPLPHESTWFPEETAPAPGETAGRGRGRGRNAQPQDDSDDDLAVARETISTKCPLTLRDFSDPVTSRKCPHSFEREAIEGLIQASTYRLAPSTTGRDEDVVDVDGVAPHLQAQVPAGSQLVNTQDGGGRGGGGRGRGGRGGQSVGVKAVQCPVPGCSNLLTEADLFVDQVLKRKIERLLRAQREAEEGSSEEDEGGGRRKRRRGGKSVVSVGSGDEIEDDEEEEVDGRTSTARRRVVKGERAVSEEL